MIQFHPIEWWVNKLDEPFSLARFGDGEFLCIQGRTGHNSHKCNYTPELRADLIECLKAPFYKGMQRIEPWHLKQVEPMLEGDWVDTEIFADLIAKGELKPFFDKLRTKKFVIVSSKQKRAFPIPYVHFIETPYTNTHLVKEKIIADVLFYGEPVIYLFACGMAAGTIVHALHGKIPGASFIDIGHIFDPFIGDNSRQYLADVPKEILDKNL